MHASSMIDTDVLLTVGKIGAGFGLFAAVLYLFTCGDVPSGFRVFPATAEEWVGYWFRSLELTFSACILLSGARIVTEVGRIVFLGSVFLLLASSVVFWRSDRTLAVSGLCFLLLAGLIVLF